ncbi:MAG: hypothetical protein IJK84_08300 [Bacteroidales bacterium]|nr:hypothetical protein [Bacteroidales bacterium]
MFRHRSFWVILLITAIVWLGVTMSEHDDYPLQVKIEWTGFDTARYVVTHADTLLPLTIKSNCFLAIGRYNTVRHRPYRIVTSGDTVIKVGDALFDNLLRQFSFHGTHGIKSNLETLSISIEERQRKGFVPQLRNVEFSFAEQCGLAGEPVIKPDTVWLYGDTATLKSISEVVTSPARLTQLNDTSLITLALDPVWLRHPQLHCSTDSVHLFLPIDRYVEKTLTVPVSFESGDKQLQVRLHPERVDITLWVPVREYDNITADMVHLTVDYSPGDKSQSLPVRATLFPAGTRVKQISPSTIQYVIIY